MDSSNIRRFATEARNLLKAGIAAKMISLGFDRRGSVAEEFRPQLLQGGSVWNGQLQTESFYYQWTSLADRISQKGINEVCEEAAYTWFNRLCAIRILQKNVLCAPVLDYVGAARTPRIVDEARQGHLPPMREEVRQRLAELLDDDTKTTEQFAVLIMAWCHANPIIEACFGSAADYTELLLPGNILSPGGFLDRLNHTEFLTDDDFRSPELIGWLYQFYISERKDEVYAAFKKGNKAEAEDIPAATQIFTPNWIVKYMVQNTLGRIYLDNNPYECGISEKWRYLVEPSERTAADEVLKYGELTDLRIADLACGSGHILNECFDLLYDLYIAEGYSRREAIENIFRCNLTGIDIDLRARQLATFALLLKACQRDGGFADARVLPRVLSMPKVNVYTYKETSGHFTCAYQMQHESRRVAEELTTAFTLMHEADTLGSIMKFDVSAETRAFMQQCLNAYQANPLFVSNFQPLIDAYRLILALSDRYHVIVMNPPYMGGKNMNATLSRYVKDNYPEGKADLFAVFMEVASDRLAERGKYGMINMQSWMFLSSFERLRTSLLDNYRIESMLHLGPRTFDELSGEVVQNTAFIIGQDAPNPCGTYFRLIEGKDCADKERMFLSAAVGKRIYYPDVPQENFKKIPGCPIGYWVSEKMIGAFTERPLREKAYIQEGLKTGDNARFIRYWYEVDFNKTNIVLNGFAKWVKHTKGGCFRRWYEGALNVLNYENEGFELRHYGGSSLTGVQNYFLENITYNRISSSKRSFRFTDNGSIPNMAGLAIYPKDECDIRYLLGWLNTCITDKVISMVNPTLNIPPGVIDKLPFKMHVELKDTIDRIVEENIAISRADWDAHETSWDFQENELVRLSKEEGEGGHSLKDLIGRYKDEWTAKFMRLHANEEELNRQFIAIYGLEDELTPDVPLDEVTILQAGEISIEDK